MGLLYEHVRRDSQKPKRPSNWGAYLNALKEAHVPRHVTDLLDGIRQNYRNPIVHPDAILTTDQAIVLLPQGVAAIFQMVQLMPQPEPKPAL